MENKESEKYLITSEDGINIQVNSISEDDKLMTQNGYGLVKFDQGKIFEYHPGQESWVEIPSTWEAANQLWSS